MSTSNDNEKSPSKRGRPKKIKTQEEIDFEKQKKREIKQKWYQERKYNIQQQHKKYYEENKDNLSEKHKKYYKENKEYVQMQYKENRDELKNKSKHLQSKYREGYRFLCKLLEDNIIPETYINFESIKNIIQ
jgi:CRISPR/Cas system-associated endonuclease Cas1